MGIQKTKIQKNFKLVKAILPSFLSVWIRIITTAVFTPIRFSINSGHFKSSIKQKAVDKNGFALPWYSYPAIEFLQSKDFSNKTILEFGAGQSTLWWAKAAKSVKSFEKDPKWYKSVKESIPENVDIIHLSEEDDQDSLKIIDQVLLAQNKRYDIIIIDGLTRKELCKTAISYLNEGGIIITDNSEGYGFKEAFDNTGFKRVDFHGFSPGVVLKQATSFFFKNDSFIFENDSEIKLEY
jgi:hypothetical protein